MAEKTRKSKVKALGRLDLSSKFWKTFLTVLAAFFIFVGPTYIPYVLIRIMEIDHFLSMVSGVVLFIAGLMLMWYLIRNKVIS